MVSIDYVALQNHPNMSTIIFREESYAIQGAIFAVYREMGCGFLESVYQECLEKELALRNIPYTPQAELELFYKGKPLKQKYRPDIICYNKIIFELKATKLITRDYEAQIINYLKAANMRLGFLVNFGSHPKVEIKRYAF